MSPADPVRSESGHPATAAPAPNRIRYVATGLLVLMTATFVTAGAFETTHPALAFVRAFAEAAMIGALADWFAVVALFRHPLGLPIPHTAVIPRNKDRIGEGLGRFVQEHFLAPDVVAEKLATADIAGDLARWATAGDHADLFASRITKLLPAFLDALDDEDIQRLIRRSVVEQLRKIPLAPVAGEALDLLTADRRHQVLVDDLARKAATLVDDYEDAIRRKVAENTAWLWKMVGVDAKISDKLIDVARKTLTEVAADPDHALRVRVDRWLAELAHDLRSSAQYREAGEQLKDALLAHPALSSYLERIWGDVRREIRADALHEDSRLRVHLAELVRGISATILGDDAVRRKLNRLFRGAVLQTISAQRAEIAAMISGTIRRWDTQTFSGRIEAEVGADLQYIRINGTLIGGLAGLVIYGASRLL